MSFVANHQLLCVAYDALKELVEEVVFVGGATACLYVDQKIAEEIRPTIDVDCTLELANYTAYHHFEKKLIQKGFVNDTSPGAPICRFKFKDTLILDVMSSDGEALGFTNTWYKDGIANRQKVKLDSHRQIYIFPLAYFLASKFEAFNSRGRNYPRFSSDLEDIILVLDGINDFEKAYTGKAEDVKLFLAKQSEICLADVDILEVVSGIMRNNRGKVDRIKDRLKAIINTNS